MSTPGRSKVKAGQALRDRCLTVANPDDATSIFRHLDSSTGGIVLSSVSSVGRGALTAIRQRYPGLVVTEDHREREREAQPATPQAPLALPALADTLLAATTPEEALEQYIDGQVQAGAHIGVAPGRVVHVEDTDSLTAQIDLVNTLMRDDVIVRVVLDYPWMRPSNVSQCVALLVKIRHPIALSLSAAQDPLDNKGVPAGLRLLIDALPDKVILWKTDLAGIDALAHGALGAAIGVSTTLRHSRPPGGFCRRLDKNDDAPRVFVPSLLRYVRASYMRDEWFPSTRPWTCNCPACHGRPIDRFTGATTDKREASVHNAIGITALYRELMAQGRDHRLDLWHEKLEAAQLAHITLATAISRKVELPSVLKFWLEHA